MTKLRVLLSVLSLLLLHCNGNSKEQQVHVDIYPASPIVFTAPISYPGTGGTTTTINPPWFRFQANVNNLSDEPVTILGVKVTIHSGGSSSTSVSFDPSQSNFNTTDVTCAFSDFGEFDPGGSSTGPIFNNTTLFSIGSGINCSNFVVSPIFYVSGGATAPQPTPTNPNPIINTNLAVTAEFIGWFGSRTSPSNRFDKFVYFNTQ